MSMNSSHGGKKNTIYKRKSNTKLKKIEATHLHNAFIAICTSTSAPQIGA